MSTPENKFPEHETGDPKTNNAEQDVITNNEESDKVVNQDNVVADTAGIEATLSETDPSPTLNADEQITNHDNSDTGTNAGEVL